MNEQLSSWNDLRVLLAIGHAGTLSGAGRILGISHPTVYRRLNKMEARLGVRLFERSRNGYTLTLAGEEMMALAERLESDIVDIERKIAGRDLRPFGTVRVTTTDTLLIGYLSRIFAEFQKTHAQIDLEVIVSNESFNLSKREADVAIRPSKDVPEQLVGRKICDIAMAVYAHPDICPQPEQDVDFDELPWIGPEQSLEYLPLAKWLRERGLDKHIVYKSNTLLGCLDAARAGIGAAILPCYLVSDTDGLVQLGPPVEKLNSELWLLTHPDLRNVARIRAFLDFMADALKANPKFNETTQRN